MALINLALPLLLAARARENRAFGLPREGKAWPRAPRSGYALPSCQMGSQGHTPSPQDHSPSESSSSSSSAPCRVLRGPSVSSSSTPCRVLRGPSIPEEQGAEPCDSHPQGPAKSQQGQEGGQAYNPAWCPRFPPLTSSRWRGALGRNWEVTGLGTGLPIPVGLHFQEGRH